MYLGLYLGKVYGFSLGIFLGILLDCFVGKRIGLNGIMLGLAGLIGGIIDKNFTKENRIAVITMSFVITVLCEVISYTMQIVLLGADNNFKQIMRIIIIEAIYNAIIVTIMYPLIHKVGDSIEEIFNKNKSLIKYY